MSTLKSSLVYLAIVSAVGLGPVCLPSDAEAAVPEKASSQQEKVGSASLDAQHSTAFAL